MNLVLIDEGKILIGAIAVPLWPKAVQAYGSVEFSASTLVMFVFCP
jgi:hypothetical protein